MKAEETTNKVDFNYVWQSKEPVVQKGESVPIRKDDYLFICIEDSGNVIFRYRKCDWRTNPEPCKASTENAEYWAGATGRFDAGSGAITGQSACGTRKFTMTIEKKKDGQGFKIRCEHERNPPEGDWEADDDWGGGTQPS